MIKLSEKDAEIAFDPKHDHMACAKCLRPRMRVMAWVEEQRKLKGLK